MVILNPEIKQMCRQIIFEATAIVEYTESIEAVPNGGMVEIFDELRSDELSHLQKLVVSLTEQMTTGDTAKAEQMDEDDAGEGEGGDDK